MNKWWLLLIISCMACAGFIILGIQPGQKTNIPVSAVKPDRIVSLAPNLTEILFELGLNQNIVAVSSNSDYPAEAANKIKVGTFWHPDIEAIIACKPDLVITLWFEQQKSVAESLKRLGYRVLTLKIETIEELWTVIEKIGSATDRKQAAYELVNNIKNKLSELRNKTSHTKKIKVLWAFQTEPLRLAGRNTFINELIELAGGENAIGPTIQQYPSISTEELLACEAEVIIQSAMDAANIEKQQKAAELYWQKYPSLPAVKNNRICVLDSDAVLRLGPRLPNGLEIIAGYLHPDIFKQQDDNTKL